jgi:hypothetical protein
MDTNNIKQKEQTNTPQSEENKIGPTPTNQDLSVALEDSKKNIIFDKLFSRPIAFVDKIDSKLSRLGPLGSMSVVGRRVLIIFMTLSALLLLLIVILGLIYRLINQPIVIRENPIPSPVGKITPPPLEIRNPSMYAEDEVVLEMELKIIDLDKQITATNVRESTLNPPTFNFEVEFE